MLRKMFSCSPAKSILMKKIAGIIMRMFKSDMYFYPRQIYIIDISKYLFIALQSTSSREPSFTLFFACILVTFNIIDIIFLGNKIYKMQEKNYIPAILFLTELM